MKRRLMAALMALTLLTGCGGKNASPAEKTEETPASVEQGEPAVREEPTAPAGLTLEMEHAVYAPNVERMTYFIRNETAETVEFGEAYTVQRMKDGVWEDLETAGEIAWIAVLYTLESGSAMALECTLSPEIYGRALVPGQYRLEKVVGGQMLNAEFELGESIYTAETPHGFAPLEQLPENYGAAAAGEMDAVFTGDGVKNLTAVEEFLFKSGLGVDCQLRTVQDHGEGAPMVIDVIHENDHFLWRMWSDSYVTEKRFSYIVTDGTALYLANGADWENQQNYGGGAVLPLLIPEGVTAEMVKTVEEQTAARLEGNVTRYKVWSDDGIWCAGLSAFDPEEPGWGSPTEFFISWQKQGEGSWGNTYNLQNWDGLETAITAMGWQEDGTLRLTCGTMNGESYVLTFDPQTEQLATALHSGN